LPSFRFGTIRVQVVHKNLNRLEVKRLMKCPNSNCNSEIDKTKQRKAESNFYACKNCGTILYRQGKD
ncbi:MAG: hypothetical protein ACETVQ_02625, partial [Candidatus Bathyarchaeia archaeon]